MKVDRHSLTRDTTITLGLAHTQERHLIKTRSPAVFKVSMLIVRTICQPMVRFTTAGATRDPLATLIGFVCWLLADGAQSLVAARITLRAEGVNMVVFVAPQAWTHRTGARRTEGFAHGLQLEGLTEVCNEMGKKVVKKLKDREED